MHSPFVVASSSSIGGRQTQEDRLVCVPDLNEHVPEETRSDQAPPRSYYGIFDGHGGSACSEYLANTFHVELARSPLLTSDPKGALQDVWDTLDGRFYDLCAQRASQAEAGAVGKTQDGVKTAGTEARPSATNFPRDGSTATVVLIVGKTLYAANCGDSAGILIRKDGSVQSVTKDHGTLNAEEFERVRRSGGYYRHQTTPAPMRCPLCCLSTDVIVGKPRVYPGGLLVTRAFGDCSAKVAGLGGSPGVIIADCEEVVEMPVGDDWAEVIIASDGVWDVVRRQEMPQILAKLGGQGANSEASRSSPVDDSDIQSAGSSASEGDEKMERMNREETVLKSICAKLVLSCIKSRYWKDNMAVADNASVIILRFLGPSHPKGALSVDQSVEN